MSSTISHSCPYAEGLPPAGVAMPRAATTSSSQAITPTADPTRYARGPPSFSQPTHWSWAM